MKIILMIMALIWASCASVPKKVFTESELATTKAKTAGSKDIQLLPHQLKPISYLLNHPEQKGILVNHYMGTGKTYLGIGMIQAFKDRPVIVLAPKFLESNWEESIKNFGVNNPDRINFVSYQDAPAVLSNKDLKNFVIIADEVHNLVKYLRSTDQDQNTRYTKLYMNLRNAHKIVGLTGTPVYSDESDLAFMINLVAGQDLMPFNQEAFRLQFTEVLTTRQFFRGYVLESNMLRSVAPLFFLFAGLGLTMGGSPDWLPALGAGLGIGVGVGLPVALSKWMPLETFKLRKLDVEAMSDILGKYVSYFRFDESQFAEFPAQELETVMVPYSREQYSFFLRLVEGDLEVSHLQRLLANDSIHMPDEHVALNSTAIHENFYRVVGAGRDIGNFEFRNAFGAVSEPPKFLKILESLNQFDEPTVIYSNYEVTGILAFQEFLKRQNYNRKYAYVHPGLNSEQVGEIITGYNSGAIKLLLLHPEVTEGISLKGTQHLHILEPIINSTVQEQVIGRTRRFKSHSHLPKDKQLVKVHIWQSESAGANWGLGDIYRANWFKRYNELSYMSSWGIGIMQIDKKFDRKALNPEELAQIKLNTLKSNLSAMQELLTKVSIENQP